MVFCLSTSWAFVGDRDRQKLCQVVVRGWSGSLTRGDCSVAGRRGASVGCGFLLVRVDAVVERGRVMKESERTEHVAKRTMSRSGS